MAAPSNAVLLDYEANLEDAVAAYLATVSTLAGVQILTPRTLFAVSPKLLTPRVAISYAVSGTGTQQNNRTTDGAEYRSYKNGTLTMIGSIQRDGTGQSLTTLRGGLRVAMLEATAALNGTTLPYYQVVNLIEGASSLGSYDGNDEIWCQLTYRCDLFIKPDQWAAS